jgi:imidazolonepropionase
LTHAGDLLIVKARQVVTCEPDLSDGSDPEAAELGLIQEGSILVSDRKIRWVGAASDLPAEASGTGRVLDAAGMVVLPGLVDAHTHAVFMGTREREYEMRIRGMTYMEIAQQGGGIISTVSQVRQASLGDLVETSLPRLAGMLRRGTTTVEIKSGYGLDLENELKMLEAIRRLDQQSPVDLVPTFLGAHEFPPEYKDKPGRYVDLVVNGMIPAVAEARLAEFCDVFCERGVFTVEQARLILLRGKEFGLKPKIHADEFADSGAAGVAAEVGAVSAGHLAFASRQGLLAMKQAGTVAVLLPGVSLGLGRCEFADARRMLDLGLQVAVATDFNPGSSMVDSLLIAGSLACSFMKMTPAEVILAITRHAAKALDRQNRIGSLAVGKIADLVLFDVPDFRYIPYHLGGDMVATVIKNGEVVFTRSQGYGPESRIN